MTEKYFKLLQIFLWLQEYGKAIPPLKMQMRMKIF